MNSLLEHPLVVRLGWTLLHFLWQGAAIALLLAAGNQILRAARPGARYTLACAALFAMAACPPVTLWTLTPRVPDSAGMAAPRGPGLMRLAKSPEAPEISAPPASIPVPVEAEPAVADAPLASRLEPAGQFWQAIFVGIWLAGVMALSLRHSWGWLRLRALRNGALPIDDPTLLEVLDTLKARLGITTAIRLLASARIPTPAVIGFFKPAILFPLSVLTGLSPQQFSAVLAHELAHARRWDFPVNLLQCAIETILFYNPGVWWVSRVVRREREFCADDLAIEAGNEPVTYARALAALAEMQPAALAVPATGGSVIARIRRILGKPEPRRGGAFSVAIGLMTATVLGTALFLARTVAQEDPGLAVKPGESIQAAVDRAAEGAVVHLAPGDFTERVLVSKRITLQGSGWDKTRLILPPEDAEKRKQFELRIQTAKTSDERDALIEQSRAMLNGPALLIRDAKGVTVRGIRVTAGAKDDATRQLPPIAIIREAQARVLDCAFTGPGQDGIHILGAADVEIANTLVAGLWGEGVVIAAGGGADPKVLIRDSEVRNIYHYGIQIGRGCDRVSIMRCRIFGTAWHGIRYDHASPLIEDNTIAAHARSGIYASGRTRATVRGNLFHGNEMDGISCWFNNEDLIEQNTFADNRREGVMVLGASKPRIRSNIFWGHPIAVMEGKINNDGADAKGTALLENNVFWQNQKNRPVDDKDSLPAETTSLIADPQFVNASARDFQLRANSPAKAAGAGATNPPSFTSAWPILPEEKQLIPEGSSRDSNAWKKPGANPQPKANLQQRRAQLYNSVQEVVKDALQIDDEERRKGAVEKIRTMIGSRDDQEAARGLVAYASIGQVKFDKPSFRELLLSKLDSGDAFIRAQAIGALSAGAGTRQDLERILKLSKDEDSSARNAVAWAAVSLTKNDLTGPEGAKWVEMFEAGNADFQKEMIHGLWGVKTTKELQERLATLSRENRGLGYDTLYYALSTSPNKQEACVTRLIEYLADVDGTNVAGRASWGLGYGVEPDQQARVATAMLKVYTARDSGYMRNNALSALQAYARPEHVAELEKLATKPGIADEEKKKLENIIGAAAQRE